MLFDAVLHLAARTVELLVQSLRQPLLRAQVSYHEPGILFAVELFGFGHHAARPAPAPGGRLVRELREHARHFAGPLVDLRGLLDLRLDDASQPLVAGEANDITYAVVLAPFQ